VWGDVEGWKRFMCGVTVSACEVRRRMGIYMDLVLFLMLSKKLFSDSSLRYFFLSRYTVSKIPSSFRSGVFFFIRFRVGKDIYEKTS
jgi:hypothetical protein